ncbi:MAG: FkbM family methyltransferase [Bacteroidota bacterium]|nr:FkbM family methyltransferase [Bacteroidota bacterium]
MRKFLKKIIHLWPWPLTVNERYDRQTNAILKNVLKPDSICVDVGAYHGEILRLMMSYAPNGTHIAFEPVPEEYILLRDNFNNKATVYPYALGNTNTETTFNHVVSNPTYSGLQQRQYKQEEIINQIIVQVRRMDDIIPPATPVHLIKIDVEGGEYDVFLGAKRLLEQWHPYLIFEHGIGGADKYGVNPTDVYNMLVGQLGYTITLMSDFLKDDHALGFTPEEFEDQFWKGKNCYFLAYYYPSKNSRL